MTPTVAILCEFQFYTPIHNFDMSVNTRVQVAEISQIAYVSSVHNHIYTISHRSQWSGPQIKDQDYDGINRAFKVHIHPT